MQTCASPQYIQTHGIPQHPEQLAKFSTIFFSSMAGRRNWKFKTLEGVIFLMVQRKGTPRIHRAEIPPSSAIFANSK